MFQIFWAKSYERMSQHKKKRQKKRQKNKSKNQKLKSQKAKKLIKLDKNTKTKQFANKPA